MIRKRIKSYGWGWACPTWLWHIYSWLRTQVSLLVMLGGWYAVSDMKPGLAACKASTLAPVLFLHPSALFSVFFFVCLEGIILLITECSFYLLNFTEPWEPKHYYFKGSLFAYRRDMVLKLYVYYTQYVQGFDHYRCHPVANRFA